MGVGTGVNRTYTQAGPPQMHLLGVCRVTVVNEAGQTEGFSLHAVRKGLARCAECKRDRWAA